ncbi:TPA: KilA-N domain-containing protein [Salmonella enterica]|nr:KilA-N domain-containing protein [Salmonella enterica]
MNQLLVIDGVSVRRDQEGRYCLNDLHRAAGGEKRHQPSNWSSLAQTHELIVEILSAPDITGAAPLVTVAGGNNQGTFVCKDLVYSYAMWISPAFHLKVIRTFDAAVNQYQNPASLVATDKIQAGVILLESAARMLNLSNSSKLGAYQKLQKVAGLPDLMPSYAIDAPAGAPDGSSRPTFAISALLKQHGIRMTANQAYHQLAKLGVVEQKYRESRSGINGVKKFWSVTPKGGSYGKNITSPVNPRETQPHFFEYRFPDLLKLLETAH